MNVSLLLLVFISLFLELPQSTRSLPLHTNSRWILDEGGRRVKLACVNWPSHLEPLLAEGLSKQPIDTISKRIVSLGFNCVRFTWPLFMATNETLGNLTVRYNFESLGLNESIAGIRVNNPSFLDIPIIKAYQEVVSNLEENSIMIVLDNHISKPGWCCSNSDGNGFFGDRYFDPELWIAGLTRMATLFSNYSHVIAMSLRNELRGPKQNVADWYRYMSRGAEAVHAANPRVLIIFSGLSFDNDLSFLHSKQLNLTFTNKLIFEMHWYSFSDGSAWLEGNPNQICGRITGNVMKRAGFLLEQGWPLFLSEFGVDQRGNNIADNRYLSCAMGLVAELDLDWALWTLQGSYYLRQGILGLEEVFGVLGWDWCRTRNITFLQRIAAIQAPFQGPGLSGIDPYNIIFHPASGLCILRTAVLEPPVLGPCNESEAWTYSTAQQTLQLRDTYFCLETVGVGEPAQLGLACSGINTKWRMISDSKMHLSSTLPDGNTVCLDVGAEGIIVTNKCRCLSGDLSCEADSQWFKIITSSRNVVSRSFLSLPGTSKCVDDKFSLL